MTVWHGLTQQQEVEVTGAPVNGETQKAPLLMLSGCHVARAQWGRNTKRRADKAQDWYSTSGGWRDVVGRAVKKAGRRWISPQRAWAQIVDNWINQDYERPSAASTVTLGEIRILEKLKKKHKHATQQTFNIFFSWSRGKLIKKSIHRCWCQVWEGILGQMKQTIPLQTTPSSNQCKLKVAIHTRFLIQSLPDFPAVTESLKNSWDSSDLFSD